MSAGPAAGAGGRQRLSALVAWSVMQPFLAAQVQLVQGRIEQVLIFRNPEKLAGLGRDRSLSPR